MTTAEKKDDGPRSGLRCLDGQTVPNELARRWRRYVELPQALQAGIWDALAPLLHGVQEHVVQQHVTQLAESHSIEIGDVALALEACRILVSKATAHNLDAAAFDEDLRALAGNDDRPAARAALVEGYDRGKQLIRQSFVKDSIAEHGNVLTGVNWRVDRILASSHGLALDTTILLMTLHYRDAEDDKRLILQVSDDTLRLLRGFCDQMLKLGAETPAKTAKGDPTGDKP